jgi:phosphonate transport system substrate-binding protein
MDYLGSHVDNAKFVVEASRDYQAYEVKFRERAPHFLLPNPWQTLEAIKVGYRVIAMAGKADDFKGIFIARKDRAIRQPDQLRGGKVSYPSPTALAACMMPQWYLHTHGIDINRDVQNFYVGSQESSIMNAYIGEVLVGATWPPPWRLFQQQRPDEAAQLEVVWETEPLLNNSVMVRDDVPPAVADQVREWLLKLADQPQGGTILQGMQTEGFYLADDRSYQPVREFIATFEAEIRPVESL